MHEEKLKLLLLHRIKTITDTPINLGDFSIVRSQWRSQNNIGGSYSYAGIHAQPKDWANMARPIFENKWYFCGEHTHRKYRSTVHGAFMSGKDAA
jgi:hypothetical protein